MEFPNKDKATCAVKRPRESPKKESDLQSPLRFSQRISKRLVNREAVECVIQAGMLLMVNGMVSGLADLTGTAGSDTVTIAIKRVTRSFWFPGACNSYIYTLP